MTKQEAYELFAENLRTIREENGFSQSELARRVGVAPSYICDLESKRRPGVTLATIADLATALGVSPASMLSTVRSHHYEKIGAA